MKRFALWGAILAGLNVAVLVGTGGAGAQPVGPPPIVNPGAAIIAEQHAEMRAEIAAARAQAKAAGASREQIRALRAALRAKLAAMRH
ncbi:MAG TPA: hypothetical protein VFI23_01215 [Rhizomicrobium sp.]|nr:hypothetical protein [Rhizomicrobium sp.]